MKGKSKKLFLIFILTVFVISMLNCNQYLGNTRPDKNGELLQVGALNTGYFGSYPRVWVVDTKSKTRYRMEAIER